MHLQWCGPCKAFTPILSKFYKERKAASASSGAPSLEIVFISSDRDEAAFKSYATGMPWLALPFSARAVKEELSKICHVEGIPTLIFLRRDGSVLTLDGRGKVTGAPDAYPWPPVPVDSMEDAVDTINDFPTMVLFTDKCTDAASEEAAVAAFTTVARRYFQDGAPSNAIRFAHASGDDEATIAVRKFLGAAHLRDPDGATSIRVTIVDVPGRRKVLYADGALGVPSEESLLSLAAAFVSETAKSLPIKD